MFFLVLKVCGRLVDEGENVYVRDGILIVTKNGAVKMVQKLVINKYKLLFALIEFFLYDKRNY